MSTNVMVACRFRPPSKGEKAAGASIVSNVDPNCTSVSVGGSDKFNFDRVFDFVSTQEEVYRHTAQPFIKEIFNGYNSTILTYGQTGSGKTHTMMGGKSEVDKGIIPRLVDAIFNGIEEAEVGIEFTVKLSYVEIYNERVRDLLTPRNANSDNLKIREGTHGGVYIEGVTETYVNSIEQVLQMMQQGQDNRAIASTNMNEQSSRSHSVFILTLGQVDQNTGSKRGAKLTLVDLAGSEKVGKTGAAGQTLTEAQSINKSLSSLGNVINALTSGDAHVPYRDSKLTRLLSSSLGGNAKTCLLVTGSPMSTNMEETISTLRFGTRAKLIKNHAKMNQEKSVAEYKILLHQAMVKIGIQSNIIEVLEKDVANLLECVDAVEPQHLKLPVPKLMSRDVAMLESLKTSKSMEFEGSASPVPPTPTATTTPPPVAAAPAAATTAAAPKPSAAPRKSIKPVVRKPAVESSAETSPATSPDTTPSSSPQVKPSPSPIDEVAPIALDTAAAAPAPSPAAAASHDRKASVSLPGHNLSDLMLSLSEVTQQLEELRQVRRALEHNLEDSKKDAAEANDAFEREKTRLAELAAAESRAKSDAEERAEKAAEIITEFNLLKQKAEYERKEHALALSEAEGEKTELAEEVQRLTHKLAAVEGKMQTQTQAYETAIEKVAQEHAAAAAAAAAAVEPTAASEPNSPNIDPEERRRARARMSAPPEHMQARDVADRLMRAAPVSEEGESSASLSSDELSQIEQLNAGLKRKCDQYVQLTIAHQAQAERVDTLESALDETSTKLKDLTASSSRKIKELDEKLLAAENLCAKFLESGRYWRQERQQSKQSTSKIVMPLHGGGGKAKGGDASSLAGSSVTTPTPTNPSSSSRLSGGIASGARSAITSIQSAISGKPKDSMSAFF